MSSSVDYSYQLGFVEQVWGHLETDGRCVLAAGCGAGKTRTAAQLITKWLGNNPGKRVLFLAHAQRLLREQTAAVFAHETAFTSSELGVRGFDPTAQVHVAIPQSKAITAHQYGLIVIDEAHQYTSGRMVSSILASNPEASCLLLTASHAEYTWKKWPVVTYSIIELWDRGVVVDPTVEVLRTSQEYRQFLDADGNLSQSVALERIPELLAPFRSRIEAGGKHMVACHNQQAALEVATYLGESAVISTSETDPRGEAIADFRTNPDVRVLVVVYRGVLGFNMPELETVIDLTGSENVDRVFQLLGRVIRRPVNTEKDARYYKLATDSSFAWTHYLMSGVMMLTHPAVYAKWDGKLGSLRVKFDRGSAATAYQQVSGDTIAALRQRAPRIPRFGDVVDVMRDSDAGKLTSLTTVRSVLVGDGKDPEGRIAAIWAYWDEHGRPPPENSALYSSLCSYTNPGNNTYREEVRAEALRRGWTTRVHVSHEDMELQVISYCERQGHWPTATDHDPATRKLGEFRQAHVRRSPDFAERIAPWRAASTLRNQENRKRRMSRPVRNVSTGEVFDSARAADIALGLARGQVSSALCKQCRAGGFEWQYVDINGVCG